MWSDFQKSYWILKGLKEEVLTKEDLGNSWEIFADLRQIEMDIFMTSGHEITEKHTSTWRFDWNKESDFDGDIFKKRIFTCIEKSKDLLRSHQIKSLGI